MADWLQFKDVKSTAMGVSVTTFPPMTLPEERVEFVTVPGRSGALTVTEGEAVYEDITLSVDCLMKDQSKLDAMSGWLRGRGQLVLGNRPSCYYAARVVNQIEITKLIRGKPHRTFAVAFRCAPYRYQYPAPAPVDFTAPGSITNPGNVYAEPVITVAGSGDIELTIGSRTLAIEGVNGSITIDTPARLAYSGTTNQSFKLTGDWPTLPVGATTVSWTGSVSKLSISPHWRNL